MAPSLQSFAACLPHFIGLLHVCCMAASLKSFAAWLPHFSRLLHVSLTSLVCCMFAVWLPHLSRLLHGSVTSVACCMSPSLHWFAACLPHFSGLLHVCWMSAPLQYAACLPHFSGLLHGCLTAVVCCMSPSIEWFAAFSPTSIVWACIALLHVPLTSAVSCVPCLPRINGLLSLLFLAAVVCVCVKVFTVCLPHFNFLLSTDVALKRPSSLL